MSSPADQLFATKNIPTGLAALQQAYLGVQGTKNVADIAAATLVSAIAGRVAQVVVSTAGSAVGHIYDQTAAGVTKRVLFVIPMAVGIYPVNMPANYGIVVAPGTGQVVTVSYS